MGIDARLFFVGTTMWRDGCTHASRVSEARLSFCSTHM
jgi:hypothetical protein